MINDRTALLGTMKATRDAGQYESVRLVCEALKERLGTGLAKAQGETLDRRRAQAAERSRRYRQRQKALPISGGSPISLPGEQGENEGGNRSIKADQAGN
jgi:hypothetical protein